MTSTDDVVRSLQRCHVWESTVPDAASSTLPCLVRDVLEGRHRWPPDGTDEQLICLSHGVIVTDVGLPVLSRLPTIPPDLMLHRPPPKRPHLVGSGQWCGLLGDPVVRGVGRWVSALGLGVGEEVALKKAVSLLSVLAAGTITATVVRSRICRSARQTKPLRQQIRKEQPVDPTSRYGRAVLNGATPCSSLLAPADPPPLAKYVREALAGRVPPRLWTSELCELLDREAEIAATVSLRVAVDTGWSGEELLAALRSSGPTKSRRLGHHLSEPRLAAVLAGVASTGVAGALLWHFACRTPPAQIPELVLAGWHRSLGEIAGWPPPSPPISPCPALLPAPAWFAELDMSA